MRIGINGSGFAGPRSGATCRIENLAAALARRGEEVLLYVPTRANVLLPLHPGVEIVRLPIPPGPAIARAAAERTIFPKRAREDRLDLFETSLIPAPNLRETPMLLTIHGLRHLALGQLSPFSRRLLAGPMLRGACQRAARAIAVSEFTKGEIVRLLGVAPEKIDVVPNAADHIAVPSASAPRQKTVLFVGHLEPRKNLALLIAAFARARESGLPHRLLLVGTAKGSHGEELRALAASRGVEGSIEFLGPLEGEDLARSYGSAELFVFPSLYEGFGIPLLEAMRCGTPVLASKTSGIPEVGGDACVYADPHSESEWVEKMHSLLENAALRAELARRGLAQEARYRWDSSAELLLEAARRALK